MRRTTLPLLATAIVLALGLAACGGQDDPALEQPPIDDPNADEDPDDAPVDDDPVGDEDPPGDEPADPGDDPAAGGSDSREITIATADAAERAGVSVDEVTFVTFEMVTWPDGSLGCPEPDQMYTQALVDGYRIVLEADGERYVYHGAIGDDPFYCPDPASPVDG